MPNKRRCKQCGEYSREFIKTPKGTFCTYEHAAQWGIADDHRKREKQRAKQAREAKRDAKQKEKADRAKHRERKKALLTRSDWYNKLEKLVNQYVLKVRDKHKPCCTCGTSKPTIKYDAGHCFTKAARPDIRFELTNIHKQCSFNCNKHKSGNVAVYKQFIIDTYGQSHLEQLERHQPPLKEQFPEISDIEAEITRYRKLLRAAGVKPCR